MAIAMHLWQITEVGISPIPKSDLNMEKRLEQWILTDPTVLDLDMLIIGNQVRTDYGGYIDILGLNRDGDLVIVELKRQKTPREIVAQCLDYASWVCDLQYDDIVDLYKNGDLAEAFREKFEEPLPETLNSNHQIVIVAASLDDSTERIIQYLADKADLNINAVFFNIFSLDGREMLGRSWLKDPVAAEMKPRRSKRAPWTGYYYVNTGIDADSCRDWDLSVRYSYVSAGGAPRWVNAIRKLQSQDKIFTYVKGTGYVGYGVVQAEAVMVQDYQVDGKRLVDDLPADHAWRREGQDPNRTEWMARVQWIKTFPVEQAKTFPGIFANQNVVCKLSDEQTFDFLAKEFGVEVGD